MQESSGGEPLTYSKYVSELRSASVEWFHDRGYAVSERRPYCLSARDDWRNNIVDDAAVRFVEDEIRRNREARTPFPLHQYAHHGLSSQALLFNLIGPMAGRGDLRPLEAALRDLGVPWPASGASAEFEYEDREVFNERQAQPTSIDCVVGDADSAGGIYIECKLVETGFGGCSVYAGGNCDGANPSRDFDGCYLHRIGRTYLARMREHGLFETGLQRDTWCPFINHYQFYRELLLALQKRGHFVLLGDARSPVFVRQDGGVAKGTWTRLVAMLPPQARSRVAYLTVQQLVERAEQLGGHDWTAAFRAKYGLRHRGECCRDEVLSVCVRYAP